VRDAAFAGVFVDRLLSIGVGAFVVSCLIGSARARWPELGGVAGWGAAAALTLGAAVVKLAVVSHPLAIVGDGLFQVHRAQAVHAGHLFFTSITPKPFFEFPYPVALYVAALPFWSWFPGELDLLRLLRGLTLGAEAVAGVALFVAVRRQWPDRAAAWLVVLLWPLARAPFDALSNANLTNLFGQTSFATAMAVVAWMAASGRAGWRAPGLLWLMLVVAWLSHFGTLTVGIIITTVLTGSLVALGRGSARRAGAIVALVACLAGAAAWVAYYGDPSFRTVYQQTYERVRAPQQDDSSKLVASPGVKWQRWWDGVGDDYGRPGVPVLLACLAGLLMIGRQRPRDGAGLVFLAWIAAWIGLSVLGLLTPMTFRANLAAAPAVAVASAFAIGAVAGRGRSGLALAAIATAVLAWDGWQVAVSCLRLS
jgi:hypothetical protein